MREREREGGGEYSYRRIELMVMLNTLHNANDHFHF